jgi:hypothetical protein
LSEILLWAPDGKVHTPARALDRRDQARADAGGARRPRGGDVARRCGPPLMPGRRAPVVGRVLRREPRWQRQLDVL